MNFNTYRYFNEVAETGSIRRAADRLHVAPSAISRQLSLLEHSLGIMLLERSNTGIQLTPAGIMLERYTRNMFRELERIHDSIKNLKGLRQGEVKIWVIEGLLLDFLPRTIGEFNERHPAIQFSVFSESSDRIVEALIRDETDIGIVFNAKNRPGIEIIKEYPAPIKCLVAPNHPFAGRSMLTLEEICGQPIALPIASFGLRQIFDKSIGQLNLSPHSIVSTNNLELTKMLAINGRTVAIGPELIAAREMQQGLLKAIPVDNEGLNAACAAICVHRDRPLSYAAHEFMKKITSAFSLMREGRL